MHSSPAVASHFLHSEPQNSGSVSDLQRSPQRWKPVSQLKSHCPPVQAGLPLLGAVLQEVHSVPQYPGSVFKRQVVPHR